MLKVLHGRDPRRSPVPGLRSSTAVRRRISRPPGRRREEKGKEKGRRKKKNNSHACTAGFRVSHHVAKDVGVEVVPQGKGKREKGKRKNPRPEWFIKKTLLSHLGGGVY